MPESLRVAALQFDVRRGDVAANLHRVEVGLREAAGRGVELVCLPEMWPTSFVETLGAEEVDWWGPTATALEHLRALSGELGLIVCGSSFAPGERRADGERLRNRLQVFDRGEPVLVYDKVHLFSPTGERESFSAGSQLPPTVEVRGLRLSGVVCYDLRFAPLLRAPYLDEAELLVVPAQWPTPRASHWRGLAIGRAVEAQCCVLAVNRLGSESIGRRDPEGRPGRVLDFPGNSLVVDPAGVVLAEGRGEDGLVVAELDLERVRRLRREVPVRRDQRPDVYRGDGA